jgi:hypothetical protein
VLMVVERWIQHSINIVIIILEVLETIKPLHNTCRSLSH